MNRLLIAGLLALGLSSCVIIRDDTPKPGTISGGNSGGTISGPSKPAPTVSGGIRITIGVRLSDQITSFAPNKGEGASYSIGEGVTFRIGVSRPGYVTLAIFNLTDPQNNYCEITNIPVDTGINTIPRNTRIEASAPRGTSYVRAYFSTTQRESRSGCSTYASQAAIDARTKAYLGFYPEDTRDVAETYLVVR